MVKFEFSYEALTSAEINQFEQEFEVKLPIDYRKFLLDNNGGKPVKRRFKTADGTITTSIMLFFPLFDEVELNLKNIYNKYNVGKIVPSNLMPIGIDPADSLICIEIDGNNKVYFCDMDYFEEDNKLKEEYIKLVSENLSTFLNNLYEG